MNQSGLVPNWGPNVYRTVTAGNLKTQSGVVPRCACFLNFTNTDAASQTAVFTGPDGASVTKTIPPGGDPVYYGDFSTLVSLGTNVTCVAGWIDDGTLSRNT